MDKNNLKMGPHDVGGEESLPIDTTDNDMTHWEKYANALRIVVSSKRIITLDELRYHTEALGAKYFEIGYFDISASKNTSLELRRAKNVPSNLFFEL